MWATFKNVEKPPKLLFYANGSEGVSNFVPLQHTYNYNQNFANTSVSERQTHFRHLNCPDTITEKELKERFFNQKS